MWIMGGISPDLLHGSKGLDHGYAHRVRKTSKKDMKMSHVDEPALQHSQMQARIRRGGSKEDIRLVK